MSTKKIAVVVGVGAGLGESVVRRFAKDGYVVAMIARRADALRKTRDTLRAEGLDVHAFAADAADAQALEDAFALVRAQLGEPDVLVYNAAVYEPGYPSRLSEERLVQSFRTNVVGALVAAQQVIPAMRARKQGTILLTGGGLALTPFAQMTALSIGKAGIRSLAFTLAGELLSEGIHVATVTVCGIIDPKTKFAPDAIATVYAELVAEPKERWRTEVVFE